LVLQERAVWVAAVATFDANPVFLVGFLAVWAVVMGSYLHFCLRVAPAAFRRWADAEGYQIVERKQASIFDWFSFAAGSGHHVYRVVLRDREGRDHEGLVRVGSPYWFCASARRCPVEVRWGAVTGTLERLRRITDPTRFGWKAGSSRGQLVVRRTVLAFAFADLALATVLLAMESGCLFVIAFTVDDLWNGSLGLNRYFGRVAQPELISEARLVIAQALGFFALYLPALVTLTVGGIGLFLRKPWGYYSHLTGSALVAVTCFGIVYTIPALAFALRPEFKAYLQAPKATKPVPDPLEEL
jgi:hypothetical protein